MIGLRRAALCVILHINSAWSLAEYDQFPGFNNDITTLSEIKGSMTSLNTSSNSNVTVNSVETTTRTTTYTRFHRAQVERKEINSTMAAPLTTVEPFTTQNPLFTNTVPYKPSVCPEEEKPMNLGPYEVPTQRDLAIHLKSTLRNRFNSYHQKALMFLNDIKGATRATSEVEGKCPSRRRPIYKQCVKHVNTQCQTITKGLVTSLERQRHDVEAFTESSICNFSSMQADPVQLIKTVAMEEASLEFALAGFLRLLSACGHYCKSVTPAYQQKPSRHIILSDQDLVIKYFLTRKNYVPLLKDNPSHLKRKKIFT